MYDSLQVKKKKKNSRQMQVNLLLRKSIVSVDHLLLEMTEKKQTNWYKKNTETLYMLY